MRTAFRRLLRILQPGHGKHRGRPVRVVKRGLPDDMAWLGELLPATPPAEPGESEPWQPRVTRYVRLAFPLPDDTIILAVWS